jgi:heptosyltransferase I
MRIRGNPRLKLLDRMLGVPLVRVLSLLPKHPRVDPSTLKRVALLKTAAIGDTLLLSGPIDDLRRALPNAELVLITGEDNREAGELLASRVDRRIAISPRRPGAAVRTLRRERFDAVLDFGAWPRFDAIVTALSQARVRAGFATRGQSRHHAFDVVVEHSAELHEIDNYRRLVAEFGATKHVAPHLGPSRTLEADRIPEAPFVVFHPWSGGYNGHVKEWSPSLWVELGIKMHERGWSVLVTGSAAEHERAAVIESALGGFGCTAFNGAGEYTLAELTDVLVASEAVISVNTGVMHLAAMLGALTVSLEGPTPVHRWGPLGPRAHSVATPLPGCGFLNLGFEYRKHRADCMSGITPEAVESVLARALSPRGVSA